MRKVLLSSFWVLVCLCLTSAWAVAGDKVVGYSQVDNQNPWRLAETESVKELYLSPISSIRSTGYRTP